MSSSACIGFGALGRGRGFGLRCHLLSLLLKLCWCFLLMALPWPLGDSLLNFSRIPIFCSRLVTLVLVLVVPRFWTTWTTNACVIPRSELERSLPLLMLRPLRPVPASAKANVLPERTSQNSFSFSFSYTATLATNTPSGPDSCCSARAYATHFSKVFKYQSTPINIMPLSNPNIRPPPCLGSQNCSRSPRLPSRPRLATPPKLATPSSYLDLMVSKR